MRSGRPELGQLIGHINQIVARESIDAHPFTGSGSTLTLGQIIGDQLLLAHVGDSAVYVLHAGRIEKRITDHTLAQELLDRDGEGARATCGVSAYRHAVSANRRPCRSTKAASSWRRVIGYCFAPTA